MSKTYSLFVDDAVTPSTDQPDTIHSIEGEIKRIVTLLMLQQMQSTSEREMRLAAAMGHLRLKAAIVIQNAIGRNDDVTIVRWYQATFFQDSELLSNEEKILADKALQRNALLGQIRNKEKFLTKEDAVFLIGSNLLRTSERRLFSEVLSPQISAT